MKYLFPALILKKSFEIIVYGYGRVFLRPSLHINCYLFPV